MFWGLKITSGNHYNSLVEKSFHVSHAVLEPCSNISDGFVEVHIVLHKVDYIVCLLSQSCPQQPLNLEISEGEEMTVYIKARIEACVHLTGYHVIEESYEGGSGSEWEGNWDDENITSNDEEDVNEGLSEFILGQEEFPSDEEDSDYIMDYPSLSHLEQNMSSNQLIPSTEEDEFASEDYSATKRKRDSNKTKTKNLKKRKVVPLEEVDDNKKRKIDKKSKKKSENKTISQKVTDSKITNEKVTNGKVTSPKVTEDHSKEKKKSSVIQENCKTTLPCGVNVEELKYGTGKIAKKGAKVSIRYSGHSTGDNPLYDSLGSDEKPLGFILGKGEVMPGLDQGIKGMKVGGRRRLIIPPSQRREGDVPSEIPKDSNICLDVTLISIK